ncbi:kinase-like domain-containing protein [Mycena olivaceomarginata]|nr:kinase-like domain-containing protein [Mycena olivaceomarginata]
MQSPFKTIVSWVTEAHNQFLKWNRWDKFDWAVEEHTVWSEIHRLGRGENWKGKEWLSDTWANQIMDFLEKWMPCQDLTLDQKQRIAYSLRRLSNRYQISTQTSNRLVSAAISLGDSSELPLELIINQEKLEGGTTSSVPPGLVCNPHCIGGSSDVRIGYYRFQQKREQVAIKEFRFLKKPYDETKPRFTLEAFTWAQLSKGDPPFVVKFFGADISTESLRLISQWQINDNIVHFLNLDENSHEDFRCQKICQVAHAISWLHSKDVVHADIKGANILVDAKGVPKLADFGISRIIHETIDESQEAIHNPSNSEPQSLLGVMKPWDADGPELNADSAPITKARSTGMGFAGSINWMAPERFRSPHQPTKASDVYAFAFLVVEIFANGPPFSDCNNKTVMELLHGNFSSMASQSAENPDLQDLRPDSLTSEELWKIMVGCMRYQPSSRLTAKDVHTEMKALCGRLRE